MLHPGLWNKIIVIGWYAFFGVFMGLDFLVWITKNPHIPTFSQTVCGTLPRWIVLPLTLLLVYHFADIYARQGR